LVWRGEAGTNNDAPSGIPSCPTCGGGELEIVEEEEEFEDDLRGRTRVRLVAVWTCLGCGERGVS